MERISQKTNGLYIGYGILGEERKTIRVALRDLDISNYYGIKEVSSNIQESIYHCISKNVEPATMIIASEVIGLTPAPFDTTIASISKESVEHFQKTLNEIIEKSTPRLQN
jgi:hypothetical protein